jgi:mono/diheme cytochrome c family protein
LIRINETQRYRAVRRTVAAAVLAALAVAAGPAAGQQSAIFPNPVEPKPGPDINLGRMNYEARCATCHGKTGGGTDRGPTFISRIYHPGHHGDAAFLIAPKQGVRAHHWGFGDMPPVPGVTDAELQSILRYVRAVQKANGVF